MFRCRRSVVVLWSFLAVAPLLAQTTPSPLPPWFPEAALEGAAEQLANGIRAVREGSSEEQVLEAGERGVRDLLTAIDDWGVTGLTERRPVFTEVEVPAIEHPLVSLVATYGVCSLGVYEELAASPREKFYVRLVEVSVGLISAFLRDQALSSGLTDADLREALTSTTWDALARRLAEDEAARAHVNAQCGPVFSALLD